jgi:hypothetical protein
MVTRQVPERWVLTEVVDKVHDPVTFHFFFPVDLVDTSDDTL